MLWQKLSKERDSCCFFVALLFSEPFIGALASSDPQLFEAGSVKFADIAPKVR